MIQMGALYKSFPLTHNTYSASMAGIVSRCTVCVVWLKAW